MRVAPATLKTWLHDGNELALLDVREAGEFGEGHLFFAIPAAYSRLELDVPRLVPRPGARVVLCDDGASGVADRAARRMHALGYTAVSILDGGTAAWAAAGFALFKGVNVPSKCFGELVEHAYHTPRVTAVELAAMVARGEDVVILDGRPFAEFQKMSIPGATCCPNGELAYRFRELVPRPDTRVVINCAGRTRSIIGAQTLINFGVPNPVMALENGTQGWMLADLELDHGASRRYPETVHADAIEAQRRGAAAMAERAGVRHVDAPTVERWLDDPARTTYLCDVRTRAEFDAGTVAGAVHAPGGQLIQATDQWIGVRNARIVLVDAEGVRAPAVASWLAQLGYETYVLGEGGAARLRGRAGVRAVLPALPETSTVAGGTLVDLGPSMAYRKRHVAGARWSTRSRIVGAVAGSADPIVLHAPERELAQLAAVDLHEAGRRDVRLLASAAAVAMNTESTPSRPSDAECIDYLFFVHDRHEGNKAAARGYLEWETGLLRQIDAAERATFKI